MDTEGSAYSVKSPTSPRVSSAYLKYFENVVIDSLKYGGCLLCGKLGNGRFKKLIKRTDHNTSGLKKHMERIHKAEVALLSNAESRSTSSSPVPLKIKIKHQNVNNLFFLKKKKTQTINVAANGDDIFCQHTNTHTWC